MLVGGNGAGKSTFYDRVLKPLGMPFINADLIARDLYPDNPEAMSYQAAKLAENLRNEHLESGDSFCFETVFSHPSKIDFIARAKAFGYQVILVVIHVGNSALNRARIAQRVIDGGHRVPDEKVLARIPRMLDHVRLAIPLCDQVRALDNSRLDQPFLPVLTIRGGLRTLHMDPLPEWAQAF
ncbi:AAA family ATPase [Marinobacterium aestuariivivens]|uniref:AAA family ATPase n=1 Tax=Marinobacterium aestuariivivens TaxID=1698799 RepID=A0ABW2A6V2_9GAMM